MNKVSMKLIVFFDEPFWVAVMEQDSLGALQVARYVFGQEPSEQEIQDFLYLKFKHVTFSPSVDAKLQKTITNPKRKQRVVHKQMHSNPLSTKSQLAMKLAQEQQKVAKKTRGKQEKEEEKRERFQKKQQKKKAKHRGR